MKDRFLQFFLTEPVMREVNNMFRRDKRQPSRDIKMIEYFLGSIIKALYYTDLIL